MACWSGLVVVAPSSLTFKNGGNQVAVVFPLLALLLARAEVPRALQEVARRLAELWRDQGVALELGQQPERQLG